MSKIFLDGSVCHLSSLSFNEAAFLDVAKSHFNVNDMKLITHLEVSGGHIMNKMLKYNFLGVFKDKYDYVLLDTTYLDGRPEWRYYLDQFKKTTNNILFFNNKLCTDDVMQNIFKEHVEYLHYSPNGIENYKYVHFVKCYESYRIYYEYCFRNIITSTCPDWMNSPNQKPFETDLENVRHSLFNETSEFTPDLQNQTWQKPSYYIKRPIDVVISSKFTSILHGKFRCVCLERFADFMDLDRRISVSVNGNQVCHMEKRDAPNYSINMFHRIEVPEELTHDGNNLLEISLEPESKCGFLLFSPHVFYC